MKIGSLAKGTVIYGIGSVLTRMLSLLTLPLFTAYLAPAEYGISALLTLMSTLLASVFTLGLGTSLGVVYFRKEEDAHRHATIWSGFSVLLASAVALMLVGAAASGTLSAIAFHTPDHAHLVTLTLTATGFSILSLPFQLGLQFEKRAKDFVALSAASSVLGVLVSMTLVMGLRWGVLGIVVGSACAQALSFAFFGAGFLRGRNFALRADLARALLALGAPMIPSFFAMFVLQQTNRYVLEWFQGLGAVGVYSVGASLGMAMTLVVTAFSNAWTPYFLSFREKREEAEALFGRIATYYFLGFGTISLLFYVFATPLVHVMAAAPYQGAAVAVGPTATAYMLIGAYALFLPPLYFTEEVKFSSAIQGVAAAIAIALNLLLIPALGILGAALAHGLGFLLMIALQHAWNLSQRPRYLAIRYEWPRLAAFFLLYLATAGIMSWPRGWPLLHELGLSLLVASALVPAVLILLTEKERRRLLELFTNARRRLGKPRSAA